LVRAADSRVDLWTTCPTCTQQYTGEADVGLARARWDRVRGRTDDDEERLFVANNLAVALNESAHDAAGALVLLEEVLAVRRRTLGDAHPATLDSLANLALQHHEMGQYETALPLSEEATSSSRLILGAEHETTLVAMVSLAALLANMGEHARARSLHEEALDARQRTLGDAHLETMNSTYLLGVCLLGMGQHEAGLKLLDRAASNARKVLGEAHPSTQHYAEGTREWRSSLQQT
jgi:tetratricopeptide (TPR) repeat protein